MDDSPMEVIEAVSMEVGRASCSLESLQLTEDLKSTAVFTDLPSGVLDGIFDCFDLKASAAFRSVCSEWDHRLTSAYHFRTFHSSLEKFGSSFGQDAVKVELCKVAHDLYYSALCVLERTQRRTYVRKLAVSGKGSENLAEQKPVPFEKLLSAIAKFSNLQSLTLHQHRISTDELKQVIWSLPNGCVVCLKDVRVYDVDKYVLPASWMFTRRSGFVHVSSMVKVHMRGLDKEKKADDPANETCFAREIVLLARRFADPMDNSELESIKNHLHQRFDLMGLETVVRDIIRLYEQWDFVYWNVIVLDVKALAPLTARLLEKLVLDIL